jgi:cyclic pyranopterin phosphate synthase
MEPDVRFMPREDLLSVEELARVATICASLGVRKLRITGGEPTVHPELVEIIRRLAAIEGIDDLAMTTNGALMDRDSLLAWREAGLTRITLSLDSLREDRFTRMTRSRSTPGAVVRGARDALGLGFAPIKLNAVIVRGVNDDEIVALAALARELGVEMRFIEFMPLDSAHAWDPSKLVPADEVVKRISAVFPLEPVGRAHESSTSLEYRFADGKDGLIGMIAPVTHPFCGRCSRLRITADGKVRPCLFSLDEYPLAPLLRAGADDDRIARFLADATWAKQAGHGITAPGFRQPDRPMSAIGG